MTFALETFALALLTESLFFDEDSSSHGKVRLVDEREPRERYFASFNPECQVFSIAQWERDGHADDAETEFGTYPTAEAAAEALLVLAREQNLAPHVLYKDYPAGAEGRSRGGQLESFRIEVFVLALLAESLFVDEDLDSYGNLTLVDEKTQQERYNASFDPDDRVFLIEAATEWEHIDVDGDGRLDYWLATDGTEYSTHPTAEAAAQVILSLACEQDLVPSLTHLQADEDQDEGDSETD